MLRDNDNSSGGGELPTDGITGAPEKRGRGRPKGSKNKVSRDARAMLAAHGPAGIEMLCRIAAGRTVYRPRAGGSREKLVPDLDQMLAAQKIIVDRLVPTLKAQELTVEHIGEEGPTNTRDLARGVLDVLRMAEIENAPVPEAEPAQLAPPPPAHETEPEAREPVSTPEPENQEPAREYFASGYYIKRKGDGWDIFDPFDSYQGHEADREAAKRIAEGLQIPRECRVVSINKHRPRVLNSRGRTT